MSPVTTIDRTTCRPEAMKRAINGTMATVVAATPAGRGHYRVLDLPAAQAWGLIERVTPGAGGDWTRDAGPARASGSMMEG